MPPRWLSNSREVMGHSFFGKAGQYFCTSASRSSFPRSESCRIAVAVMGLEMEPSRKSVEEVAGTKFSRSAIPKPCDQSNSSSPTTATETPGTLFAAMKLEAALSICVRFSEERLLLWARREAAAVQKVSKRSAREDPVQNNFGRRANGVGF